MMPRHSAIQHAFFPKHTAPAMLRQPLVSQSSKPIRALHDVATLPSAPAPAHSPAPPCPSFPRPCIAPPATSVLNIQILFFCYHEATFFYIKVSSSRPKNKNRKKSPVNAAPAKEKKMKKEYFACLGSSSPSLLHPLLAPALLRQPLYPNHPSTFFPLHFKSRRRDNLAGRLHPSWENWA